MSLSGPTKTYRGNCHCGAFIFEVATEEIKSAIGCNCSSCTKKAYLWLFLPDEAVRVVKDEGKLAEFVCGPHKSTHKFCSVCGTSVLARNPEYRPGTAVNARALQDLDIWSLKTPVHDGAKINPQWVPPVYAGPEPILPGSETDQAGAATTYHGSCRCSAVQIAVKLASLLDETYAAPVVECNCSICRRGGYIWIYPSTTQLAVQGVENLTGYSFGNRVWKKMFCRTCGVHVFTDLAVTAEEFEALPEAVKRENEPRRELRPVNIRVFNGFDPLAVKTVRVDGWGELEPGYVNP